MCTHTKHTACMEIKKKKSYRNSEVNFLSWALPVKSQITPRRISEIELLPVPGSWKCNYCLLKMR